MTGTDADAGVVDVPDWYLPTLVAAIVAAVALFALTYVPPGAGSERTDALVYALGLGDLYGPLSAVALFCGAAVVVLVGYLMYQVTVQAGAAG